jgi:serine/threonine protein kinase
MANEVYRARDSKLGRDVAIKILPAHFTADSERRARFAREARTCSGTSGWPAPTRASRRHDR